VSTTIGVTSPPARVQARTAAPAARPHKVEKSRSSMARCALAGDTIIEALTSSTTSTLGLTSSRYSFIEYTPVRA
jgi:hypothetical protein